MKKYIKLMSKHEFGSLFPYRVSECVPVKIESIGHYYSYENGDRCSIELTWRDGSHTALYVADIPHMDYKSLQNNLECEYLFNATASDEIVYLIPNKQEYGLKKEERAKHYVVTRGEYSSYHIVAVCSDRSVAEKIAERINRESYVDLGDTGYIREECDIEEYEDGDTLFDEALGVYYVNFDRGAVEEAKTSYALLNPVCEGEDGTIHGMYIFAEDKEQAMKIASDKRAMLMAQKAGL